MGWNPASDFVREWQGAATNAGRVAVAAYYTFCFLAVLVNLASIVSLLRMDLYAGCALSSVAAAAADPAEVLRVAEAHVGLLVRLWQVTIVFLFGALLLLLPPKERGGGGGKGTATRKSSSLRLHMGIVAAYWAAACLVHMSAFQGSKGSIGGPTSTPETDDSLHCVRKFWPAFAGAHNAVVLVMVAAKGVDEWWLTTKATTTKDE